MRVRDPGECGHSGAPLTRIACRVVDIYLGRIGQIWSEPEIRIDGQVAIARLSGPSTKPVSGLFEHWGLDWTMLSGRKAA